MAWFNKKKETVLEKRVEPALPAVEKDATPTINTEAGWNTIYSQAWGPAWGTAISDGASRSTGLNALQSATVWCCVNRLGTDISKLPFNMYRRNPDGGWTIETRHPVARLLRRPNRRMSQFDFLRNIVTAHQMHGNAYVAIVRNKGSGIPEQLIPLPPNAVSVSEHANGNLYYNATSRLLEPNTQIFSEEDMIHVRNMSLDGGIRGVSPLIAASNVVKLTLTTQDLAINKFANGVNFDGFIEVPQQLGPKAAQDYSRVWKEQQAGVGNAGKTPMLHGGAKFTQTSMTLQQAQLIPMQKHQIEEICRLFGVPPHKVYLLDRATFNNIEEQSQSYIDDTLMAITVPLCQAFEDDLLLDSEFDAYKLDFNFDSMLKANKQSRYESYKAGLEGGFLSINEVREMESLPRVEGGDSYHIQMNMGTINEEGEVTTTLNDEQPTQGETSDEDDNEEEAPSE